MTKRILSVLVAISLMFALASIGMAKSSSDDIIVSATKEMIFDKKITDSCHASTVLPLDDGSVIAAWFGGPSRSSEKKSDVKIYPRFAPKRMAGAIPSLFPRLMT